MDNVTLLVLNHFTLSLPLLLNAKNVPLLAKHVLLWILVLNVTLDFSNSILNVFKNVLNKVFTQIQRLNNVRFVT
jgi:hypothetical protein